MRTSRVLGTTLATALAAGLLVASPTTAQASGNSLYFPNGSDHASFGANGVVMIDGSITFDDDCLGWGGTRKGTDDFVYPATDVYIVEAGSASDGSGLTDAAGEGPNTIVGTGSGAFIGELIAVATPTGLLGEGEYDIVYDTCQDGVVDAEDEIFYDAITVDVPDGQLPPVDASIRALKDRAREEYATWLTMHIGLQALFKLDDAKAIASCLLAPSPDCLFEVFAIIKDLDTARAKGEDWIEESTLKLVANRAKNYGAIWKDPADPQFRQLPSVVPAEATVPPVSGQPVADAIAGLTAPLDAEGALTEALLHALERYQGAQADGDGEWALVQARAVRDVAAALDAHLASSTAVTDLRDAIVGDLDDVIANATDGAAVLDRIRSTGFSATERRELANRGLTTAQIGAIESDVVAQGRVYAPTAAQLTTDLDALVAAQAGMREALASTVTGWGELVDALEERVDEVHPEADAGGPYGSKGGDPVTLDASASSAAPGDAKLTTVEWDLDGDGQFDDGTGTPVEATFDESRTIAVKVTDGAGRSAVDFAQVTVSGGDRAPAIGATAPANAVALTTGETETFSVQAADPDGDALDYRWTMGGSPVDGATGDTFTYQPGADDVGARVLTAVVTAGPRSAAHSWVVTVKGPDGDGDGWSATPDCDDTRADIHPGGYERLGNGIDDDCDSRTSDAPSGGLTGAVWSWGDSYGVGRFPIADAPSPVELTGLGQARAIESASGRGYAVLADGTVRSWGTNHSGSLGDGTLNTSFVPREVRNVGNSGPLADIVEVAADEDFALARRTDGSVVAWGSNANLQLGDGTTVSSRLTPVEVLGADGLALENVAQVETGETTSYAVLTDGTVANWGVIHCDASGDITRRNTAAQNPLFGENVVQVASGDSGGAVVRKADGSVLACSSYRPLVGRSGSLTLPSQLTPTVVTGLGAGAGIVDVAMGSSTALALGEDGTVWTWGKNLNHTLDIIGLPAEYEALTPVQVPLPPGPPVIDVESDYASTMFATRADGSVLVWGANNNNGGGVGNSTYTIVGSPQIALGGGRAVAVANSAWNGLALVRPADEPEWERPLQWVGASVADAEIVEGAGGSVTLTLSEPAPDDLDVSYRVAGGDVRSATVAKGATTAPLPVTVTDDSLDEDSEQVPLQVLSVSHGVQVKGGAAVVTVLDDDAASTVSVEGVTVEEELTSLTDVELTVSLSTPSAKDVEVLWATADGSATAPADYTAAEGHVLIPAGSTSATVNVAVNGDDLPEAEEDLTVSLSDPVNATLAGGSATVVVQDSDPISVAVESPTVTEGDSGTAPATFTVRVEAVPAGESVRLPWSVKPGTAEADSDVVAASGELVFDAEHLAHEVTVDVVGDLRAEPLTSETFALAFGKAVAAPDRQVIVGDVPVAVITDQDTGPSIDAVEEAGGVEGSAITITGTASAPTTWTTEAAGCTIADPTSSTTTVTCVDEGAVAVVLTADDGVNPPVSDSTLVTVTNAAPVLTVTAPLPGTSVQLGESLAVSASATDAGSADVLTCTVDWGDGSVPSTGCTPSHAYGAAGAYDVVVTAHDGDGGTDSHTVTVTVTEPAGSPTWPFDGFFPPVDNLPVVNAVKAGSTVPVKFSLGGYRGMDIFAAGSPASVRHDCTSGLALDELEQTVTAGASALTYDPMTGRYHYNWKTQKSWAGQCRTLELTFADGTTATAEFRLR